MMRKFGSRFGAAASAIALLGVAVVGVAPQAFAAHAKMNASKVQPGHGVIIDGLFEEPNLLNPAAGPTMTYGDMVMTSLFANLYQTTPAGKIVPLIAAGMPVMSKNGLDYTFTLKHTEWNNGTPFTAADVVATWKLVTSTGFVASSTVGWAMIKAIKVANPYKFTVELSSPFSALVADCFATDYPGIVPAAVFKNLTGKAANNATYDHDPTITNGPFEFKSWTPGVSITVVPNPHWFGPKPKAKEIVFEIIPNDNTLLADAQSHSINVYYFDSITQVKQLAAIKGATVHYTVQPAWEGIELNLKNPFLDNVKVRQALQMAINTEALIKDVWKNHALPAAADQPPDSYAHNPALKPYAYDPTESKKLLAEAGFKMGSNGYLEKDGKEFTLVYSTTSGDPWRALDQELIQVWFKAIGVNVTIKDYPANAYFGTVLPSEKGWDMGEFEYEEGYDPLAAMASMYQTNGVNNYGSFNDPALNKLLNTAGAQISHSAEKADLQAAEAIIHTQLPQLFLYSPEEIDTSIDMTGYTPNPYMIDTWNCWDWAPTAS
jgi:peptide/nickel transport system substrate-binding protein